MNDPIITIAGKKKIERIAKELGYGDIKVEQVTDNVDDKALEDEREK